MRPLRSQNRLVTVNSDAVATLKKAISSVRQLYNIGLESLKADSERMAYGKMDEKATALGLGSEMLRKARKFASPREGGYTRGQLNQLCQQCERHGFAIGVSHVIVLLSVPPKQRQAIQRDAIEGHWSRAKLEVEKQKRFGKRKDTAKTPRPPATLEDAYVRFSGLCGQWKRFYESMKFSSVVTGKEHLASKLDELPPGFRAKLERVTDKIEELERDASKIMSQRRGRTRSKIVK